MFFITTQKLKSKIALRVLVIRGKKDDGDQIWFLHEEKVLPATRKGFELIQVTEEQAHRIQNNKNRVTIWKI